MITIHPLGLSLCFSADSTGSKCRKVTASSMIFEAMLKITLQIMGTNVMILCIFSGIIHTFFMNKPFAVCLYAVKSSPVVF